MIDVEQHALRALEQDSAPLAACFVEVAPDWPGILEDEVGDAFEIALQTRPVDRGLAEARSEMVMVSA